LEEKQRVLAALHEDRFVDKAPAEIFAQLLDEGVYLCSVSTMYRILREHEEVRERRNLLRHPAYKKPELLATAPNQVWSWDITKLRGPEKWSCYFLYVIIDIFSRYVVGWMVAPAQTAELAEALITETCWRQSIDQGELYIHSDRGAPMTSKPVALLLSELGITRSFSRPYVSDDNPYSEAHFKTLKYRPNFPKRFGSIQDAREFCREFFKWYNNEHYHSGIAWMTPATVHYEHSHLCNRARQKVLDKAFQEHAERFVIGRPQSHLPPREVWINKPRSAGGSEVDHLAGVVRQTES
jgi:putative transposase